MNIIKTIQHQGEMYMIRKHGWGTFLLYTLIVVVIFLIIMAVLRAREFRGQKKNYKKNKNVRVINKTQ